MTISIPLPRSWHRYLAIWWPHQWYRPRIIYTRVYTERRRLEEAVIEAAINSVYGHESIPMDRGRIITAVDALIQYRQNCPPQRKTLTSPPF